MADTLDAFPIPNSWTNLNTLSGISTGSEILLQNVGGANDIVELSIMTAQPSDDFKGIRLTQNQFFAISAGENNAWGRYIRLDRQNITRDTFLQVQEVS